ncbi:MAG: O-antigen ligase family protein [Phenylobacterium sp.]|nr:O-antigen ligase family protein [Phenylobacterium sp.]
MSPPPASAPMRPALVVRRVEGWALVVGAGLTPVLAWLGPLGFAPLLALLGLFCLGAIRVGAREWPLAVILALAVAWAALSTLWSPHRPGGDFEDNTALKLALQAPLYWAVWCAARRADVDLRGRALRVFAWGAAGYGVLLLVEALTGAGVYQAVRAAIGDPIRPDLAQKNVAQGAFVLALLWPLAFAGGLRAGTPGWLALPMAAGTALVALEFGYDAVFLAVGLALLVGATVLVWPRSAPKTAGLIIAGLLLAMPALVIILRASGLGADFPESWSQRLGYWVYALDRVAEHPWRGWGLDASRAFSPYIQLHPHNGPLQVWLELGVPGAVAAALGWIFVFRRLARDQRSLVAAGACGSAAVYALFGLVSFGVWQEWWLALAALAAVIAALADGEEVAATT